MDEWIGGREGGREERWKDGWEKGRKGRKRAVTRKGWRGEGGEKAGGGEKGEQREQGAKEGHSATGSGSADKLARSSSKSEDSPQVTLIWSCCFYLKNKGHFPLHPAMLDLQPGGQRKQDALTAHKASISRHTTAPFLTASKLICTSLGKIKALPEWALRSTMKCWFPDCLFFFFFLRYSWFTML